MAAYEEIRLFGSRSFRLWPAYVELESSSGKVRFDLQHLLPLPKTGATIDSTSRQRFWIAALAMFALYFFVPIMQPEAIAFLRSHFHPLALLAARLAYLASMAVLLALAYFRSRQYDFAAFEYEPGDPAFHVLKIGKGSAGYDNFIAALSQQISVSRATLVAAVQQ